MADFGDNPVPGREVRGKQFGSVRGLNSWLKHHPDIPVYGIQAVPEGSYALFYHPPEEDEEEEAGEGPVSP